jgi:Cd2+/Zn2+-exporting ATPase
VWSEVDLEGEEGAEKGLGSINIRIEGMDCADDGELVGRRLLSLNGVKDVRLSMEKEDVEVTFDPAEITYQDILRSLAGLGMKAYIAKETKGLRGGWWQERQQLALLGCGVIALIGFIAMWTGLPSIAFNATFGVAVLVGVYYPARKAVIALVNMVFTIHLLMLIGSIGAILLGMWGEAAILIFVYSLGDVLESYAMDKARGAIRSLKDLVPKEALIIREGGNVLVAMEEVRVGDTVMMRPGERIAVDGIIFSGSTYVDQSAVTGEPVPVKKAIGDEVFAGTINHSGSIEVRVEKEVSDMMLSRIICSVEEAQSKKSSYQRFSDAFAQYYTPAMFVLGICVAILPPLLLGWDWQTFLYRGLVVFVVSCSCGLALSVPVAIVAAMANSAKHGVVFKGGAYIEAVHKIKVMAFDKTGTLTVGRPEVMDVITLTDISEDELMSIAGGIESRSTHPIAEAIARRARERGLRLQMPQGFEEIAGKGVCAVIDGRGYTLGNERFILEKELDIVPARASLDALESQGKTVVLVGGKGALLGMIAIADGLRPETKNVIASLRASGIRTVMLTGDNERSARAIADQAGVDEYHAQLLPSDKVVMVERLKERYGAVSMVGDGINDAPALAASDVGIAMGAAGTDVAVETGDIVLMADDLSKLLFVRELSRRTVSIIHQNIAVSLVNIAFMVLAALIGLLGLVTGLLLNEASALIVIVNALRLLAIKVEERVPLPTFVQASAPTSDGGQ